MHWLPVGYLCCCTPLDGPCCDVTCSHVTCREKDRIAQEKYGKPFAELTTNEQKVGHMGAALRLHMHLA
jgi:hypothetical protein